jgi:hypothetical protein
MMKGQPAYLHSMSLWIDLDLGVADGSTSATTPYASVVSTFFYYSLALTSPAERAVFCRFS